MPTAKEIIEVFWCESIMNHIDVVSEEVEATVIYDFDKKPILALFVSEEELCIAGRNLCFDDDKYYWTCIKTCVRLNLILDVLRAIHHETTFK